MYENYAKIRDAKGLRDADVSKATGISAGTMSDWKSGRYNLKADKLMKIAEYLGVSVDQIIGGQKEGYYFDEETAKIAQSVFESYDLRALFDAAMNCSTEDLHMAIRLLKRFKETNQDG